MKSYPSGLVDLFTDEIALNAGLNVQWVIELIRRPLANDASLFAWREHFFELKRESERLPIAA